MRTRPLLHGTIIGNGILVLLTPYQASADSSSTFWGQVSSPIYPQHVSSSVASCSVSDAQQSSIPFGTFVVSPPVQRFLSGVFLVPAMMISIWCYPREAVMLLGSIATTVGSYEFSWLAFSIVRRFEVLFKYYEEPTNSDEDQRSIHLSRASNTSEHSAEDSIFQSAIVDPQQCVLAPMAEVFFYRGNRWLAALVLALPTSMILVGIDGKLLALIRPIDQSLDSFLWAYLIPTRYVLAICGWFAPNWSWMVLIWWQSEVFSVMAMMVQSCPIGVFTCSDHTNNNNLITVFTIGYAVIILFCVLTAPEQQRIVQTVLAVTGFLLVQGLGLSIIGLLDINHLDQSRDVFVLLLTVIWAAKTSSYAWKTLVAPGWGHSTPLCGRVSTSFDVENLLVAIGVGVCVTILALHFNSLPGDNVGVYSLLTVVGVACMYVGEFVIELYTGVRFTDENISGNCGLLKRITTMVFTFIPFLPYLAVQSSA